MTALAGDSRRSGLVEIRRACPVPELEIGEPVLRADFQRGFRNADILVPLFGATRKVAEVRHASAAVGRLLKRLRLADLVAKIPRTRRWKVTERGRHLLGAALQLYQRSGPQLAA